MFRLPDRTKETSNTTGTGAVSLLGAVNGHYRFSDANAVGDGNLTAYIIDDGNGAWEATFGSVTAGATDTISRGTLIKSSTGARVNFGVGTKTVAVVSLVELLLIVCGSAALVETDIASAATCDIGGLVTFRARITGTVAITSLGTAPNCMRWVRFAGALTLTHNAASLILLGAANHTTAAGDVGLYMSDAAGNWRELAYFSAAYNPALHTGTGAYVHANAASLTGGASIAGGLNVAGGISVTSSGSSFAGAITMSAGDFNCSNGSIVSGNNIYSNGFGQQVLTGGLSTTITAGGGAVQFDIVPRVNGVRLSDGATSFSAISTIDSKDDLAPIPGANPAHAAALSVKKAGLFGALKKAAPAIDDGLKDVFEIIMGHRAVIGRYKNMPEDARRPFLIWEDAMAHFPHAAVHTPARKVMDCERDDQGRPVLRISRDAAGEPIAARHPQTGEPLLDENEQPVFVLERIPQEVEIPEFKGLNYDHFIPLLMAAMQKQIGINRDLQAQLDALRARLA